MTSEDKRPELVKQTNLETALQLALDILRQRRAVDFSERCGVDVYEIDGKTVVDLPYFNEHCRFTLPDWDAEIDNGRPLYLYEKIFLLHYLASEGYETDKEGLIAFSEIPDGRFYEDAFRRRAKVPLVGIFGEIPDRLLEAATKYLDAEPTQDADVAFRVRVFPKVPVTVQLWRGDDEFPPEGNFLFKPDINHFLSAEDVAILTGMVLGKLKFALKQLDEEGELT